MCLPLLAMPTAFAQSAPNSSTPAQSDYQRALELINMGRQAEAQPLLVNALILSPKDFRIKITLGKLDALLGRKDEAVELFRQVLVEDPESADNAVNLAIALAARGSYDEALANTTAAIRRDKNSLAARRLQGKLLAETGHPAEAVAAYNAALALSPQDALTLYDFAVLCETISNLPQEVLLLRRLVHVRPETGNFHFLLGRALSRSGDKDGASQEFREAIRLEPDNRAALYNLSRAVQQQNPSESARLAARFQALKLSEEETNTIRDEGNKGVQAMQERNWQAAISTFQKALATCSGCALEGLLQKDLGLAECQAGDTASGLIALRRSLTLNPNDLDVVKAIKIAEQTSESPKK